MESEQNKQWRLYACGPRCLIESKRGQAQQLTKEAIIGDFLPRIDWWAKQCGGSTPDILLDIARHFGLHAHLQVTRDPARIIKSVIAGCTVIAATERSFDDGALPLYHYSLVESISTAGPASDSDPYLSLFTSLQDGGDRRWTVRWSELEVRLPTYVLLC